MVDDMPSSVAESWRGGMLEDDCRMLGTPTASLSQTRSGKVHFTVGRISE